MILKTMAVSFKNKKSEQDVRSIRIESQKNNSASLDIHSFRQRERPFVEVPVQRDDVFRIDIVDRKI